MADLFLEGTFLTPRPVPAVTQHFSTRGDGDPHLGTFSQAWRRVWRSRLAWGLVPLEARDAAKYCTAHTAASPRQSRLAQPGSDETEKPGTLRGR